MNEIHGMVNNMNMCYFNSLFQALISLPEFVNTVETKGAISRADDKDNIVALLAELVSSYKKGADSEYINGTKLYTTVQKRIASERAANYVGRQQDAAETFLDLLRLLGRDFKKLFKFTVERYVDHDHCKYKGKYTTLDDKSVRYLYMMHKLNPKDAKNLNLQRYIQGKQWARWLFCMNCWGYMKYYTDTITSTPVNMVVVITPDKKRYIYNFPKNMVFKNEKKEIATYELVSTIEHIGGRLASGHYITNAIRNGKVYRFDDTHVGNGSLEPNANTIMLFYRLVRKSQPCCHYIEDHPRVLYDLDTAEKMHRYSLTMNQ